MFIVTTQLYNKYDRVHTALSLSSATACILYAHRHTKRTAHTTDKFKIQLYLNLSV